MVSLRRKTVVGLDLDTSAVRMVQVRKDAAGPAVVRAAVAEIVPWGDDPQLRRVHTTQALLQGRTRGAICAKDIVCGLRGPEVVVRDFEFPPLTPEEITGAVELEVSQICPFLVEESTLDYQVTSNDEKRTMGFWVAATNGLIETTRQLVSQAGLHCALMDVAGLALLNLLELVNRGRKGQADASASPDPSLAQKAVLNLGDFCATVAIADSAGRPFVRDIGCGALAHEPQAVLAGRENTRGSVSVEDGWARHSGYRPVTNDTLVEEVATTLRYYAVQNGSARVDRLLVCGGANLTDDLLELLQARLNIEVEPWNPLADGGLRIDDTDGRDSAADGTPAPLHHLQEYGSSLALATGLALRNI